MGKYFFVNLFLDWIWIEMWNAVEKQWKYEVQPLKKTKKQNEHSNLKIQVHVVAFFLQFNSII